jgi:hypothetical protein
MLRFRDVACPAHCGLCHQPNPDGDGDSGVPALEIPEGETGGGTGSDLDADNDDATDNNPNNDPNGGFGPSGGGSSDGGDEPTDAAMGTIAADQTTVASADSGG